MSKSKPFDAPMSEQHDDHIWLTVNGEAWAIYAMDWPTIFLWRGYAPNLEFNAVELSGFNAEAYAKRALVLLDARAAIKDAPQ
jgi:hypothetical protein